MYENNSFLEKQLCFLFYVSSKEIIKRYSPYLKKYDLTYTGYIVL
ncbi:MarR family transcriptional regulator, partial [Staphylococcus condimenti]